MWKEEFPVENRYFETENGILYCGDSAIVLERFPDESVDLVVTSPPYDDVRLYDTKDIDCIWNFEKFEKVAKELYRVMKTGGVVVWVVQDAIRNYSRTGTTFKQALYFKEVCGFCLFDVMICEKDGFNMPYPFIGRYLPAFEYMLVLTKGGKPRVVNLIRDRLNKKAGTITKDGTIRQKDGSLKPADEYIIPKYSVRTNVWCYGTGYMKSSKDEIAYEHPAIFSEALARDHIYSWSNEGDLVMDIFMGSGTVAKMCEICNRRWIGIEINERYCEITKERVENIVRQPRLF